MSDTLHEAETHIVTSTLLATLKEQLTEMETRVTGKNSQKSAL